MITEYNIERTAGVCAKCGRTLQEKEEFFAVLTEAGESFAREDWCLGCWESPGRGEIANLFGVWRSRMPVRQTKRKLFVDDAMLVNFFQRLEGAQEPARVNFRFVLALVLMRKRLLVYERTIRENGAERWVVRRRGSDELHEVPDPKLDETRIGEISDQLGEILQGEL